MTAFRRIMVIAALALLPVGGIVHAQQPCPATYTVVAGDTLYSIARRCGTTVDAVMAANPTLTDPSVIAIGQQITIPGGSDPAPVTPQPPTAVPVTPELPTTVPVVQPSVAIAPDSGPPGTIVVVVANGFTPGATVEIGFATPQSASRTFETATVNQAGRIVTRLTISSLSANGDQWVVVVSDRSTGAGTPSVSSNVFTVMNTLPVDSRQVAIYMTETGQGTLGCGDALIPIQRNVLPTLPPLTAAIAELLSIRDQTVPYQGRNLYNSLHRSDLRIDSISVDDGLAIIRLSGEYRSGGVCDDPRSLAQIEYTAYQFDNILRVEVFLNGEPFESVLSQR